MRLSLESGANELYKVGVEVEGREDAESEPVGLCRELSGEFDVVVCRAMPRRVGAKGRASSTPRPGVLT